MKKGSVFASKATVGKKYLTTKGNPVEVLAIDGKNVRVKALLTGQEHVLDYRSVLHPYSEDGISKEAREMAHLTNVGNGKAKAHAKPGEKPARLEKSLAFGGERKVFTKTYKGKEYRMEKRADGFHVGDRVYPSATAAMQDITKSKITVAGAWWGVEA